jgi:hypothetical protein
MPYNAIEDKRAAQKRWRDSAKGHAWNAKPENKEKRRQRYFHHLKDRRHYLRIYGITVIEYNRMLTEQAGVCQICNLPEPSGKALAVDHNHKTKQNRGLLCENCNRAIGLLKDSAFRCMRAAEYINKYANI